MFPYIFSKKTNQEQLEAEIRGSANIFTACHAVVLETDPATGIVSTKVLMKAILDTEQEIALENIVSTHVPVEAKPLTKPVIATLVENEKVFEKGIELTYRMLPMVFDIPAGDNTGQPHTFPMSVPCNFLLLGGTIDMGVNMVGDMMAIDIPATVPVGVFTSEIMTGDESVSVDSESFKYIYKGMDILVGSEYVGRVKAYGANSFAIHGGFKKAYPAGTVYSIRYRVLDPYLITTAPLTLWISRDTDRGTVVDANTPMSFSYWNHTGTAKKVQVCMELYV